MNVRHHQHPGELLEHEGLLRGGAARLDELAGGLEVLDGALLVSAQHEDRREPGLRLGRAFDVVCVKQEDVRGLEDADVERLVLESAAAVGEKESSTLGIVGRRQLERRLVEARRRGKRAQSERAAARVQRGSPRSLDELVGRLGPGLAREPQRLDVVVREHLAVVLRPSEALDPAGGGLVPARALGPRDLAVGDVAHEHVPEGVLVLASDRRAPLGAHELLARKRVEGELGVGAFAAPNRADGAEPKDLAEDRCVLEELLLGDREPVEPRRDDALHVLGQRQLPRRAALVEQPRELLGIQRVPARAREQRRLHLCRQDGSFEQRGEQARRVIVRERRDRQRQRVRLASAPARSPLEQLRSCRAHDEQGNARAPVHEVVDEVQQVVVGPVQVLEDEHRRPLVGERLEELPPGREMLRPLAARDNLGRADERAQALEHAVPKPERAHRLGQLPFGFLGAVRLEQARLRLRHLGQRPVGHAVAVGKRAALAPVEEVGVRVDSALELVDEAALADPGHADERHQLRRTLLPRPREGPREQLELALAPDQRRAALVDVHADPRPRLARLPDRHRLRLALRLHRLGPVVVDPLPRGAERGFVHEHAVHRRRALQARSGVDDIPCDHPLALGGRRPERDERFARRHGDAHLEAAVLDDRVADREPGPHRPLGIVLVRDRRAEDRHHRVADELLDRAAVPLELAAEPRVVRRERRAHVLRVEPLGA